MACVSSVIYVRDLLDASHVFQLKKGLLAIEQVDFGVEFKTFVGWWARDVAGQRTPGQADDSFEGRGWMGEEGFEDAVARDARGAEDECCTWCL